MNIKELYAIAGEYGFSNSELDLKHHFYPYMNAQDDGPHCSLSLGGIGTGSFGRDLNGHFSRWHLRSGTHLHQPLDAARICLRWKCQDKITAYHLGTAGWEKPLPENAREVRVLFPFTIERLYDPAWPVEVFILSYSPVIPGDSETSSLPVAYFDVFVNNLSDDEVEFDAAFFWPNPTGWAHGSSDQASDQGSTALHYPDMEDQVSLAVKTPQLTWNEKCNSGNINEAVASDDDCLNGVVFKREPYCKPRSEMDGQWFIGLTGDQTAIRSSVNPCFRSCIGPEDSKWFLNNVEDYFFEHGCFRSENLSWCSVPNNVLGAALSGGVTMLPGETKPFGFVMSWDMPIVTTGSGRNWYKAYTTKFGVDGISAADIARYAVENKIKWYDQLCHWQDDHLRQMSTQALAPKIAGAMLNELYFMIDGGSYWLAGQADAGGLADPKLGKDKHFGILEGFDAGYFFINTLDLWPYAMIPLLKFWPDMNACAMRDFMNSIPIQSDQKRPFYSTGDIGFKCVKDKVVHDVGSPYGDPWHILNDYQYSNDSNLWKDHNPMFILSWMLTLKQTPSVIQMTDEDYYNLKAAAVFIESQDHDGDGLPEHTTYADCTWDALDMQGPALYSGCLTLYAWAAMSQMALMMNDEPTAEYYDALALKAAKSFDEHFWNGEYYSNVMSGENKDWVFCDGLFGQLLGLHCGLPEIINPDHVKSHLQAVYKYNYQDFCNGEKGPCMQAPGASGGSVSKGLQVGEVLVGSAWACAALMREYGLMNEADEIYNSLHATLYHKSGMQFRTPAAWTAEGYFRAPLNFRPLAIWFIVPPEIKA